MQIFIDEAGDPWFKFEKHSSKFFVIGGVIFDREKEAYACARRIDGLRKELKVPEQYEFHYTKDSLLRKQHFFQAITEYKFSYFGLIIDKKSFKEEAEYAIKQDFYHQMCYFAMEAMKDKLHDTTIYLDGKHEKSIEQNFQSYIKKKLNTDWIFRVKQVKILDSRKHNLLQLADYIASGLKCNYGSHKESLLHFIKDKKYTLTFLPKGKPTPIQKEGQSYKTVGRD